MYTFVVSFFVLVAYCTLAGQQAIATAAKVDVGRSAARKMALSIGGVLH